MVEGSCCGSRGSPLASIIEAMVGGLIFALLIDGTIVMVFAWVTIIILRETDGSLRRRGVGTGVATWALAVLGFVCFVGLWLPVGVVLAVRWIIRGSKRFA